MRVRYSFIGRLCLFIPHVVHNRVPCDATTDMVYKCCRQASQNVFKHLCNCTYLTWPMDPFAQKSVWFIRVFCRVTPGCVAPSGISYGCSCAWRFALPWGFGRPHARLPPTVDASVQRHAQFL